MHLLALSKHYPPSYIGGVERTAHAICSHVAEVCGRSRVLVTADGWSLRQSREVHEGVSVHRSPTAGSLFSTPLAPTYPWAVRRSAGWADLIHVHLPFPLAALSCLGPGLGEAPIVLTVHSLIEDGRWAGFASLSRVWWRRLFERASKVVFTSPNLRDRCRIQLPERKTRIIPPCGPDMSAGVTPRGEDAEMRADDGAACRLLFVGRLVYYKGLHVLLEAIDGLDVRLDVVGDGPLAGPLAAAVRKKGLEDRVTLHGRVSDEDLASLYGAAGLFVLPSVSSSEAFGIVQVEAMSNGVPVVNTSLPTGVPWVSRDGETGLTVPPGDAEALRDAIRTLASDPDLRARMGGRARERAARFSRSRVVGEYGRLFKAEVAGE